AATSSPPPPAADAPATADDEEEYEDAPPSPWWRDVRTLLLLGGCFCLFSFYRGLWDADESRYAEIPREMLQHHAVWLPTLDGFTYLEKPQLNYWPTEFFYWVFGVHGAVARIAPCLYFLATLVLVYDFLRRYVSREVAYAAAGMLLFQPLFAFLGIMVLTDGPLTFWLTLALVAAGNLRLAAQPLRRWAWVFWLGCLGAFLTKALVGLFFPVGILLVDLIVRGNVRQLARMTLTLILGGLLCLLACGQWLYTMTTVEPGFLHYYFIVQQFDRFVGQQHGGNWFLFLIALPAFTWPWWPLAPSLLKNVWRGLRHGRGPRPLTPDAQALDATAPPTALPATLEGQPAAAPAADANPNPNANTSRLPAHYPLRGFLFLWFASIFGFFSLSHGQLITYFLPAIPPLVMLLAIEFHAASAELQRRCLMLGWLTGWLTLAAGVAFLVGLQVADPVKLEMGAAPHQALVVGALLLMATILFYLLFGHQFLPRRAGRDPIAGYLLLLLVAEFAVATMTTNLVSADVADSQLVVRLAAAHPDYLPVHWSNHTLEADRAAGLYFGLRREVAHVGRAVAHDAKDHRGSELLYCLDQTDPTVADHLLFADWPAFVKAWTPTAGLLPKHVLLCVPRNRETELPPAVLKMEVEQPQYFGRFILYHLVLPPAGSHDHGTPRLPEFNLGNFNPAGN
ncbi:MAG: ArnT family glycosyltransferase, partial [Planctomycetota bacterium]